MLPELIIALVATGVAIMLCAVFVAMRLYPLLHVRVRILWFEFEIDGRR